MSNVMQDIRAAVSEIQEYTGDKTLGTEVYQGMARLVRVIQHPINGNSTIYPVSAWRDINDYLTYLAELVAQARLKADICSVEINAQAMAEIERQIRAQGIQVSRIDGNEFTYHLTGPRAALEKVLLEYFGYKHPSMADEWAEVKARFTTN